MMSGTCTLQVPPFRVKPCWCCILFMHFALYSFKAVRQVLAMLNVGHFGGTGAFNLACMYLVLQNVAAFGPCIYCYMYLSLQDFIFHIPLPFSPLISQ